MTRCAVQEFAMQCTAVHAQVKHLSPSTVYGLGLAPSCLCLLAASKQTVAQKSKECKLSRPRTGS
eukprot:scaffold303345_cov21-Tisochrysis_lutea.AAC.1